MEFVCTEGQALARAALLERGGARAHAFRWGMWRSAGSEDEGCRSGQPRSVWN